ncbi:MAG: M3 family metallopeptidase, partial [Planctomycetota bacterium]
YYPRDGKRGGAWCTDFRSAGWEDGKKVDPVISITCNFTKPTETTPSLLSWDETTTLFHEFGHARSNRECNFLLAIKLLGFPNQYFFNFGGSLIRKAAFRNFDLEL